MNRTKTEMKAASSAVTVAESRRETAANAEVQLADQEFQQLQKTECGWIMTDVGFEAAHATYTMATSTLAEAKMTYSYSVLMSEEAVKEAALQKFECECETQSSHATAWAEANEDNVANTAAWTQSIHIDCVIQHISESQCVSYEVPTLTQPTLCDDIESVSCGADPGSAAPVAPTSDPSASPTSEPSASPTSDPSASPTAPTDAPTDAPAVDCTGDPTSQGYMWLRRPHEAHTRLTCMYDDWSTCNGRHKRLFPDSKYTWGCNTAGGIRGPGGGGRVDSGCPLGEGAITGGGCGGKWGKCECVCCPIP